MLLRLMACCLLLAAAPALAEPLQVRGPATAAAGDLNGDNRADLLIVDGRGGVHLAYQGAPGAAGEPQFLRPVPVTAGGLLLTVYAPAQPQVTDLDGDGRLDLLFADGQGALVACRNTGTVQRAQFAPAAPLTVAAPALAPPAPAVRGTGTTVTVTPPAVPAVRPAAAATGTGIVVPPPPVQSAGATPATLPPPVLPRPELAPPAAAGLTVAFLDFSNDAQDPGLDWLAQGAPDVLALALDGDARYTLQPRARFHDRELNLANVDEVFRGVRYVIKGNYWMEGDDVVFDVAVVDMEVVDIVQSFALRGSRGNIAPLLENLQTQVKNYFAAGLTAR